MIRKDLELLACRTQARSSLLALLVTGLAMLTLAACPTPPPRFVPKKHALPDDPAALIAIADAAAKAEEPTLASLSRARAALKKALGKHPKPFEVRWRIGRNAFLMASELKNKAQLVEIAKEGMGHAEQATKLEPKRVEGHYYFALTMARIAEAKWKLTYVKAMVAAGKRAQAIDETFDHAGPLVFLGKVYLTAPAWPVSVGNSEKAVELLEKAVKLSPRPVHRLFLGQAYVAEEEPEKAKEQLKLALEGKLSARWRREAKEALAKAEDD
jgi:tetratricopeptide (TPR) repeat protein